MKRLKTSWFFTSLLAILLYVLILYLRYQQGGWEPKLDLFPQFRKNLDSRISLFLPSPQAELLSGIVLGNKKDLPADLKLALRDTSTLHIVVVSGQNLSLLGAFLMNLAGLIKRKLAIILTVLSLAGFVVLTGGQIPVLRAALMAFLAYLAQFTGRENDGLWTLLMVAAIMLLINPVWISDLSFQLSFLATFGVVVLGPVIVKRFVNQPNFLKETIIITLAAQIMITPLIIQNFHQLSLVSIPANLMVLWVVPYIMAGGIILLILSLFSTFSAQILALILQILLTYFIYIIKFFASLPFAWEYVGEQGVVIWIGYYLILAGVLLALDKTKG